MASKRIQKSKKLKKALIATQDYIRHLNNEGLAIDRAYVYGSYVRGETHKDSDIDVAVISPEFKNSFEALQFLMTKRRHKDVMSGIEAVGFSPKSFDPRKNPLATVIYREGVEVKI